MNQLNMNKLLGKNGVVHVRFKQSGNKLSANTYMYYLPDYIDPNMIYEGSELIVDSPYGGLTVVRVESIEPNDFTKITATTKQVIALIDLAPLQKWQANQEELKQVLLSTELESLRKEALGDLANNPTINKLLGFEPVYI